MWTGWTSWTVSFSLISPSLCSSCSSVCWTWTPPWLPLRFARSSSTSSGAMSTCTCTLHPPSRWMIPRCCLPTPAWIRCNTHWRPSPQIYSCEFLFFLIVLLLSLSSSQSSWTPSIRPTLWQSSAALPTHKSASVLEANTTTLTMLARTCTTTPSLRCWALGPSGTTSR